MRALICLVFAFAVSCITMSAWAVCVATPEPTAEGTATDNAARDRSGRVAAPILVNGQGPFRFLVDTGANRSVVSSDLARRLSLTPTGVGEVHSVEGVQTAPLVTGARLAFGELALDGAAMPILEGDALARADGLLGVDGLRGRRLLISFERRCVEIAPSRGAPRLRGWLAIPGRLRFGNLVVLQGRVEGVTVNLLVDTGSASSLANHALRVALEARVRRESDVRVATAGETLRLEQTLFVRRLRISEMEVRDITAYVGAFHLFELWGMADEPTLLIGMDVLGQSRGLAIDYERAVVYFQRPR